MTGDVFYTGEFAFWCFVALVVVVNGLVLTIIKQLWQRDAYEQGRADERRNRDFRQRIGDMDQQTEG